MKSQLVSLLLIFYSLQLFSQTTKVVHLDGGPVISAHVAYCSIDSTEKGSVITDTLGVYRLPATKYPTRVEISALGVCDTAFVVRDALSHPARIVMKDNAYGLQEVTITQDLIRQYSDHTSYSLYERDKKRYSTMLQALNEVPLLNVTSDGSVTYRGQSNVVLLLDGRKTTANEIKAIRKEDISKVDVYENPPARFALAGAAVVIDLRTKRRIRGGNIAVDLNDAVNTVKGENSIAGFYNWGHSRLSVMGNSSIRHYSKYVENDKIAYSYDGEQYERDKRGMDSPSHTDLNDFSVSYAYSKPNDLQIYANWKSAFYRQKKDARQSVTDNDTEYESFRSLNNRYTNNALNLYLNKEWKNNRSFLVDVTGTVYDTDYGSLVREGGEGSEHSFESNSRYDMNRKSLLASMQYSQRGWLGTWTAGINENYQQSRQQNIDSRLDLCNNTAYGFVQLYGQKDKLYYQLTMALKNIIVNRNDESVWNKWSVAPSVQLWWRPSNSLMLSGGYNYLSNVPAVSLLSETVQWLDSRYVYKGNSQLTPYSTHQVSLFANYTPKHFAVSLIGLYIYSPNAISNTFKKTSEYIVQTYDNLKYQTSYGGQLTADYFPLHDKALKMGLSGIYLWNYGKEADGKGWTGYRYQFSAYVELALRKWEAQVFYQYPGQTMEGQLVTPRTELLYLEVKYKPTERLTLGVQWNQPFMHALKEGEHTTNDAIVMTSSDYIIRDYSNMVCLKLSYNISFGKQNRQQRQKIKNVDSDSGLLVK